MKNDVIISIKNLSFSYNSNKVLDDINIDIERGAYLGLIGPNGGGKSTLLKIILGLLKPDSGRVEFAGGVNPRCSDDCRIGYVPQRISQDYQDLPATVFDIVESGLVAKEEIFKLQKNRNEVINDAIKLAGLKGLENKLIGELSGGQRQKAFVAPQILILDEPFVGVDLSSQDEFYKFLRKLNIEKGLTIIFVSHDIDIISAQAKQIIALNRKIVYTGKAEKMNEKELVDNIYGQKFTHIHHDR